MPYSIMLDAGHGGRDPGAVYQGRQEKDDTLNLLLAIGQILQERGIEIRDWENKDRVIKQVRMLGGKAYFLAEEKTRD